MADLPTDEEAFLEHLDQLVADPCNANNPLLPALERLQDIQVQQRLRLKKLLKISDGYGNLALQENQSLMARYDKQLRRLQKIARISDLYQRTMVEMNDSLRQASLHDPLTGLPNRRYMTERLREQIARQDRNADQGFLLAMFDIDLFKQINDQFGHETGDRVICTVGAMLNEMLRDYDLCARWGGEEFLILLPGLDLETGKQVADRILQKVRTTDFASVACLPPTAFPQITLSAGITEHRPDESYEDTIKRADQALFLAKERGRDMILSQ